MYARGKGGAVVDRQRTLEDEEADEAADRYEDEFWRHG